MKWIFILLLPCWAMADVCPKGDLKACQDFLSKAHKSDKGRGFAEKFNEVCGENKSFWCIKVVVRGHLDEEMVEQAKERGPKAALYPIKMDDDKYIFVLSTKEVSKEARELKSPKDPNELKKEIPPKKLENKKVEK